MTISPDGLTDYERWPILAEPYFQPYALMIYFTVVFQALDMVLHFSPLDNILYQQFKAAQPKTLETKLRKQTKQALARIVGFVHNSIQVPLAVYIMCQPALIADKLHAVSPHGRVMLTMAAGYFIHDAIDTFKNIKAEGPIYALHALTAASVFACGALTGSCMWYGGAFLMWEASTPFTQLRWYLIKTGRDNTALYFWNGILMVVTFIGARNIWGLFLSYSVYHDTNKELVSDDPNALSPFFVYASRTCNVILNCLNSFWAYKMLQKVYGVLVKGETQKATAKEHDS